MPEDLQFQAPRSGPSAGGLQLNESNPNKRTWCTVYWPRPSNGCSPNTVCGWRVLALPVWVAGCPFTKVSLDISPSFIHPLQNHDGTSVS